MAILASDPDATKGGPRRPKVMKLRPPGPGFDSATLRLYSTRPDGTRAFGAGSAKCPESLEFGSTLRVRGRRPAGGSPAGHLPGTGICEWTLLWKRLPPPHRLPERKEPALRRRPRPPIIRDESDRGRRLGLAWDWQAVRRSVRDQREVEEEGEECGPGSNPKTKKQKQRSSSVRSFPGMVLQADGLNGRFQLGFTICCSAWAASMAARSSSWRSTTAISTPLRFRTSAFHPDIDVAASLSTKARINLASG